MKRLSLFTEEVFPSYKVYHKQLEETENIEFYWNTTVSEFLYEKKLTGAKLHNVKTGEDTEISVDGAFISIGRKPASNYSKGILDMDEAYRCYGRRI